MELKPGSASNLFGIEPCIVDKEGKELKGECEGMLCMKRSWPGQMRTVGDHKGLLIHIFLSLMENTLPVMDVEEIKTVTIGLLEGLMM